MTAADEQAAGRVSRGQRPAGITVLIVLAAVKGALFLAIAVLVFAGRADPAVIEQLDSETGAVATAITFGVLGAVNLVIAVGLRHRSGLIRSIYAAIATVEAGAAVYSLVALRDLRAGSIWGLVLPVAVLWFLYGSERTATYFERG